MICRRHLIDRNPAVLRRRRRFELRSPASQAGRMHAGEHRVEDSHAISIALTGHAVQDTARARRVFGLDIGGTLTKLVHYSTTLAGESALACRVWHTAKFQDECVPVLQQLVAESKQIPNDSGIRLFTTGGGAYKYGPMLGKLFDNHGNSSSSSTIAPPDAAVNVVANEDEMSCLGAGLAFLQQYVPDEFYIYDSTVLDQSRDVLVPRAPRDVSRRPIRPGELQTDPPRPTLLANCGSGVSFLLCPTQLTAAAAAASSGLATAPETRHDMLDSNPFREEQPRRLGGTPLGGGTIFGLLKLLTGEEDFDGILALAAQGDRTKVDLTVGDIYSKAYSNIGLSGDRAAAIMGGVAIDKDREESLIQKITDSHDESTDGFLRGYSREDVARSVVFGVCYNIGLLAVMHARLHGATGAHIFVTGNLVHDSELVMGDVDFGVQVNSEHRMRAAFMRHGGFLGAVGAWVRGMQRE